MSHAALSHSSCSPGRRGRRPGPAFLVGALALALAAPGSAAAQAGKLKDPRGDVAVPALDIVSTSVSYKRALGTITATVKMAAPIDKAAADATVLIAFSGGEDCIDEAQGGIYGRLSGKSRAYGYLLNKKGTDFTGEVYGTQKVKGSTYTVSVKSAQFKKRPMECFRVTLFGPDASVTVDGLDKTDGYWQF